MISLIRQHGFPEPCLQLEIITIEWGFDVFVIRGPAQLQETEIFEEFCEEQMCIESELLEYPDENKN